MTIAVDLGREATKPTNQQHVTNVRCILLSSSTLLIFVQKTLFFGFLTKRRSITIKDTDGMLFFVKISVVRLLNFHNRSSKIIGQEVLIDHRL